MTQESAAERARLNPQHISLLERGGANVTLATLVALARAYETPIGAFFEESATPAPRTRRPRRPS